MIDRYWIDLETYSEVPISRGTDVYSRPAEIMIATYAPGNAQVALQDFTNEPIMHSDLVQMYEDVRAGRARFYSWNAYFERTLTKHVWQWDLPASAWHCVMAQSLAHSLPGGLELACDVLNVKTKKQSGGKELINLFCKPRPKNMKLRRATSETHPEEWARFLSYAIDDTASMRDCFFAMPHRNFTGSELELWWLDQRVNDRGFLCDVDFAEAARELLKENKTALDEEMFLLSGGAVEKTTQRDRLLLHLVIEYGVILDSLRADDIEAVLDDERLPEPVKDMLRIRMQGAMASTSKFTRLLNVVGPDQRMRGTLQFAGAARTARWSGRNYQPHNLRRPTMDAFSIEMCIDIVKQRKPELIPLFADNLREACSNALRGLMIAPPGKKLVVCDYSNIEGRDAAWLVNEKWKLDAFRAFDTIIPGKFDSKGKPLRAGPDMYKLAYHKSFGVLVELVTDFQRQIGKGEELSMQYGGGVGAFIAVSYSYGLDLEELGRVMPNLAHIDAITRSRKIWEWAVGKNRTLGLDEAVYVACETVKFLWREANPAFVQGWTDLENAAKAAINFPGEVFPACRCEFSYKNNWLMCKLPSGRHLMYPSPRILANGTLTYAGQVNKQWKRIKTYGGKLLENVTQASSRDILADALLRMEKEYGSIAEIVMHVHDEIVAEARETGAFNLNVLQKLMMKAPDWAAGLPIAAEGFEARRYAKH